MMATKAGSAARADAAHVAGTGNMAKGNGTAEQLVVLQNVGHTFTGDTWLFRALNRELCPGHVYALVGPSGSGKSTVLSMLAGWLEPTTGSVLRQGIRKTSWVFQNPIGVARRTVLDHVALPYLAQGMDVPQAEHLARGLLAQFGLEGRESSEYRELSGGEAKRLMLVRGVASNADLLLVDEPTAQLDVRTADTVNAGLGALSRQGMIVVVATHDHRTRDAATDVIDLEDHQ